MDDFIHRENIRLYQKLLLETTDPGKREAISALLADEQAKDRVKVPSSADDQQNRGRGLSNEVLSAKQR
jgi:hypothetical protein